MFSKPNSTALTVPKVNFYFLDLIQNKLHNSHHNDIINRVVHGRFILTSSSIVNNCNFLFKSSPINNNCEDEYMMNTFWGGVTSYVLRKC